MKSWGILFIVLLLGSCATSQTSHQSEIVSSLREGGYVIFFRHGSTDFSQKDTDRKNLANCDTQRRLNDKGRLQAKQIGEGFKLKDIPVGDIITSQYCRCVNTAKIAFGRAESSADITSIQGVSTEERMRRVSALRAMLNTPPKPGTNTVLVAHKWMFKDASGQALSEGEAAIFKPVSEGVIAQFIRRVKPEEWVNL